MDGSGMPMPRVERGGKVSIPSAWKVLAHAVIEDRDVTAAEELARVVLEAAAR